VNGAEKKNKALAMEYRANHKCSKSAASRRKGREAKGGDARNIWTKRLRTTPHEIKGGKKKENRRGKRIESSKKKPEPARKRVLTTIKDSTEEVKYYDLFFLKNDSTER